MFLFSLKVNLYYPFGSLIQQTQKFLVETKDPADARNVCLGIIWLLQFAENLQILKPW